MLPNFFDILVAIAREDFFKLKVSDRGLQFDFHRGVHQWGVGVRCLIA
jgi:hypothetical protein